MKFLILKSTLFQVLNVIYTNKTAIIYDYEKSKVISMKGDQSKSKKN
jgi:hypothetical protein